MAVRGGVQAAHAAALASLQQVFTPITKRAPPPPPRTPFNNSAPQRGVPSALTRKWDVYNPSSPGRKNALAARLAMGIIVCMH